MNIGKLNKRVTIEQRTDAPSAAGQPKPTWSEFATVWAAVEPLNGREVLQAKQSMAELSHKVTIRYRQGVDSKMRVKYGERTFSILSVIDREERHIEMQLLCQELVGREVQ